MQDKQKALFWFVLLHEIHNYLHFCAVSNLHFPVQERQLLILIRTIFMSFFPNRESTQNFSHVHTCNVTLVCACERRSTLILQVSPFHDSFNFVKFMFMWCVIFFTFIMSTISTALLNISTLEKMIYFIHMKGNRAVLWQLSLAILYPCHIFPQEKLKKQLVNLTNLYITWQEKARLGCFYRLLTPIHHSFHIKMERRKFETVFL